MGFRMELIPRDYDWQPGMQMAAPVFAQRHCAGTVSMPQFLRPCLPPLIRSRTCGGSTRTRNRCSACCCKRTRSSSGQSGLTMRATFGLQVSACVYAGHAVRPS